MEHRSGKLVVSSAGGTASSNSKTYKVSVPSLWIQEMGLSENNRNIELAFDGKRMYISAEKSLDDFVYEKKELKHNIKKISFYNSSELCTVIYADFSDETLKIKNFTSDIVKTAFGNNRYPSWEDFESFLEERCIPKERGGIREYLEAIGVSEYNPLEIIGKTKGKMAEDKQWIEIEEI